jgi:hypothetical protein
MRALPISFAVFSLLLAISSVPGHAHASPPDGGVDSSVVAPAMVIGFVGGFVKHTDLVHSGVQLIARLRQDYASGVYAEAFENHRREAAHQTILRLLDANHDGTLTEEEKQRARIMIYGHSWGASETVTLARELERDGIAVFLTVQVDSVSKRGENDAVIPANVAQAINFYQPNGVVRGRPEIRAANAARTHIIGNFRFDYEANPVRCQQYPWFDRFFFKTHIEIECDPTVWNQVESLIRSGLPAPPRSE